jgi:2-aminoadipate transaminase
VASLAEIYRARRDAMVEALRESFPPQATWTEPQGGLFVWATLPDFIDTSDLLARALRDDVAFVPGQAAYVDDGRGRSSMRLNFSGVGEDEIREGVRRIGKVITEQVELYGTLVGTGDEVAGPADIVGQGAGASAGDSGREAEQPPDDSTVLPFRKAAEGGE